MAKVVVVKFKKGCKTYYFEAGKLQLSRGQGVIVETARGIEYATVVEPEREVEEKDLISPLKPVVRIATEKDENTVKRNEERRPQAMEMCKEKIRARNLEMKLIDCEFAFDGSKVVFYFKAGWISAIWLKTSLPCFISASNCGKSAFAMKRRC